VLAAVAREAAVMWVMKIEKEGGEMSEQEPNEI
jgi:hypothetical protein